MASREKLIEKAQKYLQKGKYADALKMYDKILKDDPNDTRILLRKGEMEEKLGYEEDAVDSYSIVAQQYSDEGFYPKAIAIYKKIIKIHPEDMGVQMKLGTLYKKLNIDTEAKIYYNRVAEYYKANGLKQEYLEVIKTISEFAGDDTASKIDLAQEYLEQGDRDQAIDQFRAASQRIFESANVRELDVLVEKMDRLGLEDLDTQILQIRTYMEAGEPKKGLKIIRKVYAAHPSNTNVLEMLAQCFRALHQPNKAVSVCEELIELYNTNGELEKASRAEETKTKLEEDGAHSEGLSQQSLDALDESMDEEKEGSQGQASQKDEDSQASALDSLASFDQPSMNDATVLSKEPAEPKTKPKPSPKNKSIEEDLIQDLDFIASSEFSGNFEVEGIPTTDGTLTGETSSKDISQEILGKDTIEGSEKIQDPFSEEMSDVISFPSFEEPIENAEISEEEISGLIDKDDKKEKESKEKKKTPKDEAKEIDVSELDAEMMVQDGDQDPGELNLDEEPEGEVSEVIAIGSEDSQESKEPLKEFDAFETDSPEKSELSVNEEEFVLVQDSLDESSMNDLSKEDSAVQWAPDASAESTNDKESSMPDLSVDLPDMEDVAAPKEEVGESLDLSGMDLEAEFDLDSVPLDLDEEMQRDPSDDDAMPETSFMKPLDSKDQDEGDVDFSGQDLTQFDDNIDASLEPQDQETPEPVQDIDDDMDLGDGVEIDDEPEIELDEEQPPASERSAAPNTDLDNIQFETEHSFPEYELSNPENAMPESMSESDFFDLSDALKSEIEDLEKSFDSQDDDDEVEHLTPEEVIMEFKKGVSRTIDKSDSQTYYNLGVAYKEMGLIDEAISSFDTARKGSEYKIDATSLMGICYMDKQDYETAISTFDEILQSVSYQDPKALGIRYEKAECLIKLGRHMEAFKEFQKVMDVDQSFRDVRTRVKELAFNLGVEIQEPQNQTGKIIVNLKDRKKNKL